MIYKLPLSSNKTANALVSNIGKFIRILMTQPLNSWNPSVALMKGTCYIIFYRIFKPNVIIHFPFLAFHKVRIMGPGSISIGKNCKVQKNVFQGLTIVTLKKNANVIIGKDCVLGGLTIRCFREINIGDNALIANSLIQDTAFCEKSMVRSLFGKERIPSLPISIGKNVWVGMATCIFSGTMISDHCVISLGSFIYNTKMDEYCIASGSPVIKSLQIEKLLGLLR